MISAARLRSGIARLFAAAFLVTSDSFAQGPITWTQQTPQAPPARAAPAMAYDGASQKVVLFGGYDHTGFLGDTWTYDGNIWAQILTPVAPAARQSAAMTYDAPSNRVILFGGFDGFQYLGDTWIFDGASATWTQHTAAPAPPGAISPMSFPDPLNGRVTVFGGFSGMQYESQTWQWTGAGWVHLFPASSPSARSAGIAVLDQAHARVVIFGGLGIVSPNDTWLWNGSDWQQQSPANQPAPRYYAGGTYEPNLGRPIVFGGGDGAMDFQDLWSWSGTDWIQLAATNAPSPRESFGFVYAPALGRTVLYGGSGGLQLFDQTWTLNVPVSCCQSYCAGDGTGTACPCGNQSPIGSNAGCLSSIGTGGKLASGGTPSLSADSLVLDGSGMPSSFALYFQGTTQLSAGAGVVFGDGLRCVGGAIIRLSTKLNAAGMSHYPVAGDLPVSVRGQIGAPGMRVYQVWYRNAASFCTLSTFNLTNGYRVVWAP